MADSKISALTGATTPLAGTEVVPVVQGSTTKKVSVADLTAGRSVQVDKLGVNIAAPATQIHVQNTTEARVVTDASSNIIQLWKDAGASYAVAFGLNKPGAALGSQFKVSYTTGGAWTDGYTLDSSGNLNIDTGNLVIGTSGKGIDFSATPGTGTSELFDDYEEGVWTPAYAPTTGSFTSISYGFQQGQYIKIGGMVFVSWRMRTSALLVGIGSGTVQVTGLPFAAGGLSVEFALGVGTDFAVNNPACAKVEGSSSYINLFQERNNVSIQVTDLSTGAANNFTSGFVCYSVV